MNAVMRGRVGDICSTSTLEPRPCCPALVRPGEPCREWTVKCMKTELATVHFHICDTFCCTTLCCAVLCCCLQLQPASRQSSSCSGPSQQQTCRQHSSTSPPAAPTTHPTRQQHSSCWQPGCKTQQSLHQCVLCWVVSLRTMSSQQCRQHQRHSTTCCTTACLTAGQSWSSSRQHQQLEAVVLQQQVAKLVWCSSRKKPWRLTKRKDSRCRCPD